MKQIIRIIICLVCTLPTLTIAQHFPFDTSKYFAYYKLPDQRTRKLRIDKPYVFLANDRCLAKNNANANAKQGLTYWPQMVEVRHECWISDGSTVTICPIGKDKGDSVGNACLDISRDRFGDIGNLPRSASFDEPGGQRKPSEDWSSHTQKDLRQRFILMGGCNACADNVAQHVRVAKDSRCARVAIQALSGNEQAIDEVNSFPDYCTWNWTK